MYSSAGTIGSFHDNRCFCRDIVPFELFEPGHGSFLFVCLFWIVSVREFGTDLEQGSDFIHEEI